MSRITLSMIVRNEADRFLATVLGGAARYIDDAVIIDDGSTDETMAVVAEILRGVPHRIIHNVKSQFDTEYVLRSRQWHETLTTNPEWVLSLDADEVFDEPFVEGIRAQLDTVGPHIHAFYFRLYDMWSETAYRDDQFWSAHNYYRPFLVRPSGGLRTGGTQGWSFKQTAQHCGRFPLEVPQLPYVCSGFRLKHLGWSRLQDRVAKYERYMRLDPEGKHGWLDQYKSIMDPNPNLVPWSD